MEKTQEAEKNQALEVDGMDELDRALDMVATGRYGLE